MQLNCYVYIKSISFPLLRTKCQLSMHKKINPCFHQTVICHMFIYCSSLDNQSNKKTISIFRKNINDNTHPDTVFPHANTDNKSTIGGNKPTHQITRKVMTKLIQSKLSDISKHKHYMS